jgi:hypothetical protein
MLVEVYEGYRKAYGKAPATIRQQGYTLRRAGREVGDPVTATTGDYVAWIAGHDWSAAARRHVLGALHPFHAWLVAEAGR